MDRTVTTAAGVRRYRQRVRNGLALLLLAIVVSGCAADVYVPSPSPSQFVAATPPLAPSASAVGTAAANSSRSPLPVGPQASSVSFADPTHGWLGVEDGIFGTTDGGASWDRELSAGRVTHLWSFDTTHAWAVVADNSLYRTADGSHWFGVLGFGAAFTEMHFVTPLTGWATALTFSSPAPPRTSEGTVYRTTDGGETWHAVNTRSISSVCFSTESAGLGAEGKQIFRTVDAGRTWTLLGDIEIKDTGPWYPSLVCADPANARVQITEPGVALGNAPYLVFRSIDGGKTWTLEYRQGYTLGTTTPPNTPDLGSYPSLFGTVRASRTWIVTCTPAADAQDVLLVDASGAVLTKQRAPFVSCARDASFVDEQNGWAVAVQYQLNGATVAAQGVVLRTTDGARTWSRVYP
jgi:photosystem II stability/assembly factor-like uncharacterized protein